MRRLAMFGGSFLVTFALLLAGWSAVTGKPLFPGPTAPPAPSAPPIVTLAPTVQPTVSPTPPGSLGPTPTASPTSSPMLLPSPSPAPFRTPPPSSGPRPSGEPTGSQLFVVNGVDFATSDVPEDGRLTRNGDSVIMETTSTSSDVLWLTYRVDAAQLPAGATVTGVDTAICGRGSGQFWEVYGPTGSNPVEYEVVPPSADGCWHFTGAPGDDLSVIAVVMLESIMVVDRVEFTVYFAQ